MEMKKAIITGATGFVGSALSEELFRNGIDVWVIVRAKSISSGRLARLRDKGAHIIECDLQNIDKIPQLTNERGFDVWYQLAWDGLHGEDLLDYHKQLDNVRYLLDAVKSAAQLGCQKFVGAGSIAQYELSYVENHINGDKHSIYKVAKMSCQYMGECVGNQYGIEFIWPIITNIYGVGENSPRLVNSMIRNLQAGKHQSLSEGNQIYDFIYIADAAKAFRLIGERGRTGRKYVIAQGKAQKLKNFLYVIRDVVDPGAKLGLGELEFNGIYLPIECYDSSELVEDTGFCPDIDFAKGIQLTADWIKSSERN